MVDVVSNSEQISSTEQRAAALIEQLTEFNQLYTQGSGDSPITDLEFDELLDELQDLSTQDALSHLFAPGSKGYKLLEKDAALGAVVEAKNTIEHLAPMLSLGKAKNEDELRSWVNRMHKNGAKDFKLQAKLDGFALSAVYKNGKLLHLATRGDGLVGEDVTYLLNDSKLTILGLPLTTDKEGEFEVRGEVYFNDTQFANVNVHRKAETGEEFKNSRNAVVGLMKKAKQGLAYPVEFTYCIYTLYKNGDLQNLDLNTPAGFIPIQSVTEDQTPGLKLTNFSSDTEFYASVVKFGELRQGFSIPTDGVVIKPVNEYEMNHKMGATSHHPVSQIAYKYPGEKKITEVVNIITTVGKTGKITPVAEVVPVMVAGSLLQFLTCSNYNWLVTKDIRIRSKVKIGKANDVIPEIKHVVENPIGSQPTQVPTNCPSCTSLLVSSGDGTPARTIRCMNENCPERQIAGIIASVGKTYLNIDGLAASVVKELYAVGRVQDLGDLYTLTVEELQGMAFGTSKTTGKPIKIGLTRAQNIVKHIDDSRSLPLPRLLASLNIEGLGRTTSKRLVKVYPTLESLMSASVEELKDVDGISTITAEKIVQGLQAKTALILKMKQYGVKFGAVENQTADDKEKSDKENPVKGVSFSISGTVPQPFSNRAAMVEFIEENGGEFHTSPNKNTSFMIGTPLDSSSKVKKAVALNLPFLTPEEFTERFVS